MDLTLDTYCNERIEELVKTSGIEKNNIVSVELGPQREYSIRDRQYYFDIAIKCEDGQLYINSLSIPQRIMHLYTGESVSEALHYSLYKLTPEFTQKNPVNLESVEFYIGLALVVGKKSKDSTKHGTVITDQNHKILGLGYNGPPEGFPDSEMPTHRETSLEQAPNKYDLAIHSEVNAVTNCQHKPVGGIAYVDGKCCAPCLIHLYQNGIRKVYCLDRTSVMLDERADKVVNYVIEKSKKSKRGAPEVFVVKPSLKWLVELGEEIKNGVL